MFYDERIELAKGRVCRNVIILAVAIAGISGGVRSLSAWRNSVSLPWWGVYLWIPEAVICLVGGTALLVGLLRVLGRERDERWQTEQARFYHRAALLLLYITIGVEAILLPFSAVYGIPIYYSVPHDAVLSVLLLVLGAYAVMAFRAQDIYFNYTILERDGYAKGVVKRFGTAGVILLVCLALSWMAVLILSVCMRLSETSTFRSLVQVSVIYGMAAITLGGLYAVLSYLEWASFTRRRVVSPATMISLLLTLVLYSIYTVAAVLIDQLPISQSSAAILVNAVSALRYPIRIL